MQTTDIMKGFYTPLLEYEPVVFHQIVQLDSDWNLEIYKTSGATTMFQPLLTYNGAQVEPCPGRMRVGGGKWCFQTNAQKIVDALCDWYTEMKEAEENED